MALTVAERKKIGEAITLIERETEDDGATLILKGFGTFERRFYDSRIGRNPQTGEAVEIGPKSVLRFKAAKGQTKRN